VSGVYVINDSTATVGARTDIDGLIPRVVVDTNRCSEEGAILEMTPKVARMLARQLNKWAKLVDSVSR
jgi:hypothetical protein